MNEASLSSSAGPSPSFGRHLDRVCTDFEVALRDGGWPRIEDFVGDRENPDYFELLRELVMLEVLYRRGSGEPPTAEDYAIRFPADATLIRSAIAEVSRDRPPAPAGGTGITAIQSLPADALSNGEARECQRGVVVPAADSVLPDPVDSLSLRGAHKSAIGDSRNPENDLCMVLSPPQVADEIGRLGPYRVLKVLGVGGMGAVFLAEDELAGRFVALKVMRPEIAMRPTSRDRFKREAQAAAALSHDNIVPIWQVGEDNGCPFIAMPFLSGESLDARIKRTGSSSIGRTLKMAREVADGLSAAHAKALIHRDIKPGNIWVEGDPAAKEIADQVKRHKILDFGLARSTEQTDDGLTNTGTILGTPAYMAPEQAAGERLDARADLWSLGVVMYRMTAGRLPFTGANTMAILSSLAVGWPPPVATINPAIPAEVSLLIERLMERDRERRIGSAVEVSAEVKRITKLLQERKSAGGSKTMRTSIETSAVPASSADAARIAASQALNFEDSTDSTFSDEDLAPVRESNEPAASRPPAWLRPALFGGIAALALGVAAIPIALLSDRSNVVDARQRAWADYRKEPVVEKSRTGVEMVLIPPDGDKMTQPWRLGKYEVTQELFTRVMGWNPSNCQGEKAMGADPKTLPVENIRWYAAVDFCNELSKLEMLTPYYEIKVGKRVREEIVEAEVKILGGDGYRLPTEREWEYACRAGSDTTFGYSDREEDLDKFGWYEWNSHGRSHKVGEKLPNAFGLFDMYGNANEWCSADPVLGGVERVNRGGGWHCPISHCAASSRNLYASGIPNHDLGIRLARTPSPEPQGR